MPQSRTHHVRLRMLLALLGALALVGGTLGLTSVSEAAPVTIDGLCALQTKDAAKFGEDVVADPKLVPASPDHGRTSRSTRAAPPAGVGSRVPAGAVRTTWKCVIDASLFCVTWRAS